MARNDIRKPDKGKPNHNKLKKDREKQIFVIDLCKIYFQITITDSTTVGSVFFVSTKIALVNDMLSDACSNNRKNTLNNYPSPKPLIAGKAPLSLTRNDYKKKTLFRVSPNGVRDGGCLSAMRARSAVVVR